MADMKKTLVLIDGHSLAYRMYFALEMTQMRTSDKRPTWAIYGFFNNLFSLLKNITPDAIAVSFDVGGGTFRDELYEDYKANRDAMPDALHDQMDAIHSGVELLGIPIYEKEGYEADDVIGTLSEKASKEGWHVKILTGDQDSFQLVEDGSVEILVPGRSAKEGLKTYNRKAVFEKWSVWPEQVIDYKGLRGDTSDNIPGVPGVGEKTAVKLLTEFQDLDNLYANLDKLPKNKLLEKLQTYKDQAFLSRTLATIDRNVPIKINFDDCHLVIPDMQAMVDFFQEYEFRNFIKQAPELLAPFLSGADQVANGKPLAPLKPSGPVAPESLDTEQKPKSSAVAVLEKATADWRVDHDIISTEKQLADLMGQIKKQGVFAIDIETTGLNIFTDTLVGVAISMADGFEVYDRPAVNPLGLDNYPKTFKALRYKGKKDLSINTFYIPVGHKDDTCEQLKTETVVEALKPVLLSKDIAKIVHNAKFELNMFKEQFDLWWEGLVFDTMIASYVDNPDRRHGLKSLAFEIFKYKMQEIKDLIGTGKKQIPFSQVPVVPAAGYASCDSDATLQLARYFTDRFADLNEAEPNPETLFYETELPTALVLAHIERTGVALDTGYLKNLSETLDTKMLPLEKNIYKLAGEEFNINSPKQVGEILFDKLGITPGKKTKSKSAYSTDVKVLEELRDDHDIIGEILEYRQFFKLKSTYVDALPELIQPETGRVHTSYNQTVAVTGRLSSSNPNLQNIPVRSELGRSIRQAFVARSDADSEKYKRTSKRTQGTKGWVLLAADYSQIELRLLAHFSEDKNLVDAFQNNEDIHTATAALVFGIAKDKISKDMRYKAKAVNFGVIYGQTAHGLSQQLKIPRYEAQEFIDRYFDRYKKVKRFIEDTKSEARDTGQVKTLCGRVRDITEGLNSSIRGVREFTERSAFNTPLQGSAADLMKVAMVRLEHRLLDENRKSRMIMQVHDELVLEVPEAELEAVTKDVLWAMELGQPLKVPLVVDVNTGRTWMES